MSDKTENPELKPANFYYLEFLSNGIAKVRSATKSDGIYYGWVRQDHICRDDEAQLQAIADSFNAQATALREKGGEG